MNAMRAATITYLHIPRTTQVTTTNVITNRLIGSLRYSQVQLKVAMIAVIPTTVSGYYTHLLLLNNNYVVDQAEYQRIKPHAGGEQRQEDGQKCGIARIRIAKTATSISRCTINTPSKGTRT